MGIPLGTGSTEKGLGWEHENFQVQFPEEKEERINILN